MNHPFSGSYFTTRPPWMKWPSTTWPRCTWPPTAVTCAWPSCCSTGRPTQTRARSTGSRRCTSPARRTGSRWLSCSSSTERPSKQPLRWITFSFTFLRTHNLWIRLRERLTVIFNCEVKVKLRIHTLLSWITLMNLISSRFKSFLGIRMLF